MPGTASKSLKGARLEKQVNKLIIFGILASIAWLSLIIWAIVSIVPALVTFLTV